MLVHKFLIKTGSNALASVLSFVSLIVMTRYVGEEYGTMMWSWAFVGMFNAISDLGFNSANLKYIAKRDENQNSYFTTFFVLKTGLSIIVMVVSLAACLISIEGGAMGSENLRICVIFSIYYIVYNIQTAISVSFDGRLETGKASLLLAMEAVVRSITLIALALMQVDATLLSMGYIAGIAVSAISATYMLHKSDLRFEKPRFFREYAVFAAPLAFSIVSVCGIEYLDKVMVGMFGTSLDVGNYTASFGVVGAFTTLGTSLNNVLLPHLSRDEETAEERRQTIWTVEKYITLLILPVLTFILVLGPAIGPVLFGKEYAESGDILSVQSVHIYAFIISGLMAQILYSINKSRLYLNGTIIFTIISLIGFVTLIPSSFGGLSMAGLGGVGAACALSISYVALAIFVSKAVKSTTGIRFYPRIWRMFVSAIIQAVFIIALDTAFDIEGLLQLAFVGLVSEGVFLASSYILGEFGKEEIRFVKLALNPRMFKEN